MVTRDARSSAGEFHPPGGEKQINPAATARVRKRVIGSCWRSTGSRRPGSSASSQTGRAGFPHPAYRWSYGRGMHGVAHGAAQTIQAHLVVTASGPLVDAVACPLAAPPPVPAPETLIHILVHGVE